MSTPSPAGDSAPQLTWRQELFRFTERFGHMMSRIVLTVLYFTLVAPAGLVLAAIGDPLRIRRYRGSSWDPWEHATDDPVRSRRQD